ncbi:hypothetical protein A2U01_0090760, partial [Trifolium medium]|nr:hypothetical protein [Trifolium medium]
GVGRGPPQPTPRSATGSDDVGGCGELVMIS